MSELAQAAVHGFCSCALPVYLNPVETPFPNFEALLRIKTAKTFFKPAGL